MALQDKHQGKSRDSLRNLTRCSLFTAIALTIFMIESRIPLPIPIPGAKLGLANCVTLYVGYTMDISSAGKVLFSRILLASLFAGQLLTLLYSATGGLCCLLVFALVKPFFSHGRLWFVSPLCAVAHCMGQLCVASYVMGTKEIFYFAPYLLLLSLSSGLFVGIATQKLLERQYLWQKKTPD